MKIEAQQSRKADAPQEDRYALAGRERQEYVDAVIKSPSSKKVVVAGPGAGKTHLFRKILEGRQRALVLTFVNELVEDLSLGLGAVAEVRTLHAFARGQLRKVTKKAIEIFPKLPQVIRDDARILLNADVDFKRLFENRSDAGTHVEFYRARKDYYGLYYGFPDIVYGLVKCFERDASKIPGFDQVLVDEFQDFNALEVSLIDLLAQKSPVLLAGDDDQALYESLKSASPKHIRELFGQEGSGYARFFLPFCSRCTRVVVEAANDIIRRATDGGYLVGRINKPFRYFDAEEKDTQSDKHPTIVYRPCHPGQIPWVIQKFIEKIAEQVREKFTVLVISPTWAQSRRIASALGRRGFKEVRIMEAKRPEEPTLLDGLKLLLRKRNCNLGWRIVAKHLFDDEEFATLLEESAKDGARGFLQLIRDKDPNVVRSATGTLRVLRIVRDGRRPKDDAELADLFRKIGVDANKMAADGLKEEIGRDDEPLANPGVKKIQVTATTIQSSKGLAADYVFITHFDDLFFIKDEDKSKVSDQDICGFVVALTRAQKKAFLISSDPRRRPLFLEWIEGTRVEAVPNDIRPATDRDVSAPARRGKGARSRRRSDEVPPSHGAGE